MKKIFVYALLLTLVAMFLLFRSDLLTGWAVQNQADRIQARAHLNADWQLEHDQRQAVSDVWVSGWRMAIPVFWFVVSFLMVAFVLSLCFILWRIGLAIMPAAERHTVQEVRVIEVVQRKALECGPDMPVTVYRAPELERRKDAQHIR